MQAGKVNPNITRFLDDVAIERVAGLRSDLTNLQFSNGQLTMVFRPCESRLGVIESRLCE